MYEHLQTQKLPPNIQRARLHQRLHSNILDNPNTCHSKQHSNINRNSSEVFFASYNEALKNNFAKTFNDNTRNHAVENSRLQKMNYRRFSNIDAMPGSLFIYKDI